MIVIVDAVRTAMGGFQGSLASCTAPDLGAVAIQHAVARAGLSGTDIDEVIFGCVLPAGLKQGLHVRRCVKRVYPIVQVQPPSIKFVALA